MEDLEKQIEELRQKIATTKEEIKQSSVGREVGRLVQIRQILSNLKMQDVHYRKNTIN